MSPVVQFLLAMAPYIVPLIIAVLTYFVQAGIAKLPAKNRDLVISVVRSSVAAAEQMASDSLNGAGKKQIAVELIEKQFAAMHINIPQATVNAILEEAVLDLNLAKKAAPVTVPLPSSKVDTKGVA